MSQLCFDESSRDYKLQQEEYECSKVGEGSLNLKRNALTNAKAKYDSLFCKRQEHWDQMTAKLTECGTTRKILQKDIKKMIKKKETVRNDRV